MPEDKTNAVAKLTDKKAEITEAQKEQMYQRFRKGRQLKDIAKEFDCHERSVQRYKADGDWDKRKADESVELDTVRSKAIEQKGQDTVDTLTNAAYLLSKRVEEGILDGNPFVVNHLKELTNVVDKLQRLYLFTKAGGVDKSEVTKRIHKVDWAKMADIYLKAKKENLEYDSEGILKAVIDGEIVKDGE